MQFLSSGIIAAFVAGLSFSQQALPQPSSSAPPSTMTKMVVRLTGPGITPHSYASLPKTIYAAGSHYARIEDARDVRQGVQKLTIIAEPDAYSVNLSDKKGTHVIDQGGANDLHLPIVLSFDPGHSLPMLDRLEFGSEFDFFEAAGATKAAGSPVNGKPTDAYRLKTDNGSAVLIVKPGTHIPVRVTWQAKDGAYTYEYISYQEISFSPTLFARPKGITYQEIPPDPASPRS